MAESFNKKDRVKRKRKKRLEKAEKMQQRRLEGKKEVEFMYVDEDGNLTSTPPDPNKKKTEIALEDIVIGGAPTRPEEPVEITRFGVVKFFNNDKGYGFIIDDKTNDSVFVHIDQLQDQVTERDKVTFEMGNGPKGPMAVMVKLVK